MFSAEASFHAPSDSERSEVIRRLAQSEENLHRWLEHAASSIVHHDEECCETARLWLMAYARSMEIGSMSTLEIQAPTWLSKLFKWGPSPWPISWCELVKEEVIDCGVFAALSREIFRAQGHEAHGGQVILSYNRNCTRHWRRFWNKGCEREWRDRAAFPWVGREAVYHEICILEMPDGRARIYDSTWGTWLSPQARVGFGAILAVRSECPRLLEWGGKTLSCGEWVDL